MRESPRSLGAAALALLVAAGCSQAPRPRAAPEAVRPEVGDPVAEQLLRDIRAGMEQRRQRVRSLRGRAELSLSSPEWQGASRLEASVLAERPDRLRVRGFVALFTAFDVVSGAERFFLHVPSRREVWSGRPGELADMTGLPLVPEDLVAALFAEPFGRSDSMRLVSYDHDAAWVVWPVTDGAVVEGRFRRDRMLPSELTLRRDGRVEVSLRYTDYLREDQGWWPRELSVSWPSQESWLKLSFRELGLNPELPAEAFEFEAPEGARWMELGAVGGPGGVAGAR